MTHLEYVTDLLTRTLAMFDTVPSESEVGQLLYEMVDFLEYEIRRMGGTVPGGDE